MTLPDQLPTKAYGEPSVFLPENLLREARRQKGVTEGPVPKVCVLDPDGDIVEYLRQTGSGRLHPGWACYHTQMWVTNIDGLEVGVVGRAVGAAFAVLVAEQLAVSGAHLVISITSAGQLQALREPPYFVLIDRAIRDEGTSVHYRPPAIWSHLRPHSLERLAAWDESVGPLVSSAAWTTDAPYRETALAISEAVELGATCVEMEAAALYAFSHARGVDVVALAHITNSLATSGEDFEKGEANGAVIALRYAAAVARLVAN